MARAAVLGRLTWRVGTVVAVRDETPTARTIVLDVPGWPGHLPGQHVDLRLTAPDGYSAQRSYSIASAPAGDRLELTVVPVPDGEVSAYLTEVIAGGDQLELRGPVGGWFIWQPGSAEPVFLVGGGSGLVPLMAMIRSRAATGDESPFQLLYSVRDPASILYAEELRRRARDDKGLGVTYAFTRTAPPGSGRPAGRIDASLLLAAGWPADRRPAVFVCGPTGFVEAAANLLVDTGHDPQRIKTERFGPSGGPA
jgi:ferredoxin-NADP reductase